MEVDGPTSPERKYLKNHGNREGLDYELALSTRFLLNAMENGLDFEIGVEMKDHHKFDDWYVKYNEGGVSRICYGQAKHVLDTTKRVTFEKLKSVSDSNYGLLMYFNSFRKMARNDMTTFMICTTIPFDLTCKSKNLNDTLSFATSKDQIKIQEINSDGGLFKCGAMNLGRHYRLWIDENHLKEEVFGVTSLMTLAKVLAERVLKGDSINIEQSGMAILKQYQVPLAEEVIRDKKFSKDFLGNRNLSGPATRFRKVFIDQSIKIVKHWQSSCGNMLEQSDKVIKLDQKLVKILKALKNLDEIIKRKHLTLETDESWEDAILEIFRTSNLTIVGGLGKLDIKKTFVDNLADKIVTRHDLQSAEIDNIKKLIGYVLIWDQESLRFNLEFLELVKLPKDFEDFRTALKDMISVKYASLSTSGQSMQEELKNSDQNLPGRMVDELLKEWRGRIFVQAGKGLKSRSLEPVQKCHWTFDEDEETVNLQDVDDFFKKLRFAITPTVTDIIRQTKTYLTTKYGEDAGSKFHDTLQTRMSEWMRQKEGLLLVPRDNPYQSAKDQFLSPIWFDMIDNVPNFVGRKEQLKKLHSALMNPSEYSDPDSRSRPRMITITGLAGVGKSELVRRFATAYRDEFNGNVVWINVYRNADMQDSYTRLAGQLNIPLKHSNGQDKTTTSLALEIYAWFNVDKVLFIFDNAAQVRSTESPYEHIQRLLPSNPGSYIIITSQSSANAKQDWDGVQTLHLDVLTDEEAYHLAKLSLRDSFAKETDKDMEDLADLLGNHPLALQQAAAFIRQQYSMCQKGNRVFRIPDYIHLFRNKKNKTVYTAFPNVNVFWYKAAVLKNLLLAMDSIEKTRDGRMAMKILKMMAFIAPHAIPTQLFIKADSDREAKTLNSLLLLEKYGLISCHDQVARIHNLVQEAIHFQMAYENKRKTILRKAVNVIYKDWVSEMYRNQVLSIATEPWLPANVRNIPVYLAVWTYASHSTTVLRRHPEFAVDVWHLAAAHGQADIVKNMAGSRYDFLGKRKADDEVRTVLNIASVKGDSALCKWILSQCFDVVQWSLSSVLTQSAYRGDQEFVQYLIENYTQKLKNVLPLALSSGAAGGYLSIVSYLLQSHFQDVRHGIGSALVACIPKNQMDIFRYFLESHSDHSRANLMEALEVAVKYGQQDMAIMLIAKDDDIVKGSLGKVFVESAHLGRQWIAELLLQPQYYGDVKDQLGEALLKAATAGHHDLVALLLKKCPEEAKASINIALVSAAAEGNKDVVTILLNEFQRQDKQKVSEEVRSLAPSVTTLMPYILTTFYDDCRPVLGQALVLLTSRGNLPGVSLLLNNYLDDTKDSVTPAVLEAANLGDESVLLRFLSLTSEVSLEKMKDSLGKVLQISIRVGHQKSPLTLIKYYYDAIRGCLGKALLISLRTERSDLVSLLLQDQYRSDVEGVLSEALRNVSPTNDYLAYMLLQQCYEHVRKGLGDFFKRCVEGSHTSLIEMLLQNYTEDLRGHLGESLVAAASLDDGATMIDAIVCRGFQECKEWMDRAILQATQWGQEETVKLLRSYQP